MIMNNSEFRVGIAKNRDNVKGDCVIGREEIEGREVTTSSKI